MKILTDIETGAAMCAYEDNVQVEIQADQILIGNPVQTYILDRFQSNTVLIGGVTLPADWEPWKYLYNAGAWALNPTPA